MKSIIKKWKTYHTTQTGPTSGRQSKLSSWASRKLVQDVNVNQTTITMKDLQSSMSEIGVSVHQSTISRSLHKAGLDGQVARKKPLLKKTHLELTNKHLNDTAGMWRNALCLDERKIELFCLN